MAAGPSVFVIVINFFAADTPAFRRGEERRPPNVETSKHTRLNRRWLAQSDHRLKTPPRGQRFQNSLSNTPSSKGSLKTKTALESDRSQDRPWGASKSPSNLFLTVYSSIFLQNRGLRNHRGGVAPGAVSPPGADGSTC